MLNTRQKKKDESLKALLQVDLSNIKHKLMEPAPEGKGWSQKQVDVAEKWYRRFLEVMVVEPTLNTVPNLVIDTFWHYHILDTRAYARDCQAVFGEFIHHYPYFGLNGDAKERDSAFVETNDVYMRLFGEDCRRVAFSVARMPWWKRIFQTGSASSCNSGGSGTGCGQGCSGGSKFQASSCNSGGSGTGCGQGCGRNVDSEPDLCPFPGRGLRPAVQKMF